jgi:nucleoside-diphosphate-sugar epimerase
MLALVSGSSGFIGRHFVKRLSADGWAVLPLDVKSPIGHDARSFFRDYANTDMHFDLVVHAAAIVGGRQVIEWSPLDQTVDLELDAGLFSWATKAKPDVVVYLSSSAVYPVASQNAGMRLPLSEWLVDLNRPKLPDALYGWTKLTGEYLASLYRAQGGRVVVARPFSGYGADQDLCYPFPAMIQRALKREDPFEVWGTGRQTRDFVHVDDVVEAILTAVREGVDEPFNIGTGRGTTMLELAEMVCSAAGYTPEIVPLVSQPMGVEFRVADTRTLNHFYRAAVALEDGIARSLDAATVARS